MNDATLSSVLAAPLSRLWDRMDLVWRDYPPVVSRCPAMTDPGATECQIQIQIHIRPSILSQRRCVLIVTACGLQRLQVGSGTGSAEVAHTWSIPHSGRRPGVGEVVGGSGPKRDAAGGAVRPFGK